MIFFLASFIKTSIFILYISARNLLGTIFFLVFSMKNKIIPGCLHSKNRASQKPAGADSQPCFCSLWDGNALLRRWLPFALQSNDSRDIKLADAILILTVALGSVLIALIKVSPYSITEGHPSFRQILQWVLGDRSGTQRFQGRHSYPLPSAAMIYSCFG